MTTSYPHLLCQALDVRKEQPITWRKELIAGYGISLRPVSVHDDNDINAIHEWLSEGYPARLPADQLRVFFILLAECNYAQAFMVLLNDDTPIGQLEVYNVLHDELNDSIDAGEGDVRVYVPVMPVIEGYPDITIQILQTCLHYFFSCSEVKRVFWVIPVIDKERNKLAVKTGFRLFSAYREINLDGGQPMNVYVCTRSNFFAG